MLREVHRTIAAFSGASSSRPSADLAVSGPPITRTRAVVQLVLTLVLAPICLWALFVSPNQGATARTAASALLGAIVAFWLKD